MHAGGMTGSFTARVSCAWRMDAAAARKSAVENFMVRDTANRRAV
jgi:hypothetical protein